MTIKGKIFKIMDLQKVSDSFQKREFVLEYSENPLYPQFVLFQATQKKVEILNAFKVGDFVQVEFNLRGREWISPSGEKKYFNSLEAWKIEKGQIGSTETKQPEPLVTKEQGDDLPF